MVQALRGVLAAVEAESMLGVHHESAGVSADLGRELPLPGDRPARPAERRWCDDALVSVTDEVALSMHIAPRTAASWMNRSHDLLTRFPTLWAAMRAGRLPAHAGWQIVQVLRQLALAESCEAVVEALLAWGEIHGWSRIRSKAREFAVRAEPVVADAWHDEGVDARRMVMTPLPDGMAQLEVVASAVQIAGAFSAVANTAAGMIRSGDVRTADQLRCDLVLHRLLDTGASASATRDSEADATPTTTVMPTVVIHATVADVWAVAHATSGAAATAQLAGYGPLPHSAFAEALRTARIRYRLTDGNPVSDQSRHDPSTALATHVRDRDRTCRFPGCGRSADRSDLDHRIPFGQPGGTTTAQNLHVLCRPHHRLKHHGNWQVHPTSDGGEVWTDPTGRFYRIPPPDADLTGLDAPSETALPESCPGPDDLPDFAADIGWTYRLAV